MGKGSFLQRLWKSRTRKSIILNIGESRQRLVISPSVLNHFLKHQQRNGNSLEAGGQLFARFSEQSVTVSRITGPRATDRRTRYSYVPDRREEQKEIDEMHRKGFNFVGDWHTHAEGAPTPSPSDIKTINEAVAKSQHHLHGFVMVIVGTGSFPEALHISVNTTTSHVRLTPNP